MIGVGYECASRDARTLDQLVVKGVSPNGLGVLGLHAELLLKDILNYVSTARLR
ncbi:MAG: hypothetical protein OXI44_04975 [Bacteroidota bacterium]|nr:hypothetical protein [Bacteroidota bacterium]